MNVEPWFNGYIVSEFRYDLTSDYSGMWYTGKSGVWQEHPLIRDVFETKSEAMKFIKENSK